MTFFSHSKINNEGQSYGSKLLVDHINGVKEKAHFHHSRNLDLGLSDDELKELINIIAQFHDLGKFTCYFQNYLLKKQPVDNLLKQHARIGGFAAYNLLKDKDQKKSLIALYIIFLHHSNLIGVLQISEKLNDQLKKIIDYQKEDLIKSINQINTDLGLENISELIYYPNETPIRRGFKIWALRQQNIRSYYLINYLFSLLIEADKLDASDTQLHFPIIIDKDSVDLRFGKPTTNIAPIDIKSLSSNNLRNFCRAQVIANLDSPSILQQFLFTLTAPTGIGKTMIALDFALKFKAKIREILNVESRIIYALPFINIIEQSVKEYKDTLSDEVNILAHYQYADVFGEDKMNRNEVEDEPHYNQKLMALDTWQADIVITSFVQFFETLIGNRNKLLKKFNHYANSIIILDEVQTLRLDQMPLIGVALFYLSKFLKARVVLMTATKPKIFKLSQEQILSKEGEIADPLELLGCHEEVYATFQRTKIKPLLHLELDSEKDFIEKIFSINWQPDKSCIIVCNTVKRSIEIYNEVIVYLERIGADNPVEYLSTNIIPAHRLQRIRTIEHQIKSQLAPILISTQVVEAGVDLDFDMGFRDVGPIDSIIQVAGRINRNNIGKNHSPLYVVDFGDAKKIYGRITYDQARLALQSQPEFLEGDYLNLVSKYFDNISDKKSFTQFNKIFESMKALRYDSESMEDRPVSCFKIIEESQTTLSVFIEMGESEIVLRKKYLDKMLNNISKEKYDKNFKLDFQQRIISVPDHLAKELPPINQFSENLKLVSIDVLDQYYNLKTGFIRKPGEPVTFF